MTLMRGNIGGYEFDRMVLLFSMMDGPREIPCAVSASAMDDLERVRGPRGPAGRTIRTIARSHRAMRVAQVHGPGVRRYSSRHHPAQDRFSTADRGLGHRSCVGFSSVRPAPAAFPRALPVRRRVRAPTAPPPRPRRGWSSFAERRILQPDADMAAARDRFGDQRRMSALSQRSSTARGLLPPPAAPDRRRARRAGREAEGELFENMKR